MGNHRFDLSAEALLVELERRLAIAIERQIRTELPALLLLTYESFVLVRSSDSGFAPAVGKNDDPGAKRSCVRQPDNLPVGPILKEPLSASQHDWVDHQSEFVDQIVLHLRTHQRATAGNQNVPTRLLLQLPHLRRDIPLDQARIAPLDLCQGRRNEFGEAVHPVGKALFIGHRWPGRSEALIGHAPKQKRQEKSSSSLYFAYSSLKN
jgi:hypothetical protein